MPKVIIHVTMSLDGFIAGPNDEMDWSFQYTADDMPLKVMQSTGAIVLGKRTLDISLQNNQLPYGGTLPAPQFVLTDEPQPPRTIQGIPFTFVTGGIAPAVELAQAAAGDKNVSLLGASIAQQALRAQLVDEIIIHLAPILLGQGVRLFDHLGADPIRLERLDIAATGQITSLRFRVLPSAQL